MLHHSTPRGLYLLLPPSILLAIHNRSWRNREILSLQLATALGLVSYFAQNKGFIYHRYPWVAFALLWLTLECTQTLRSPARTAHIVAAATLAAAIAGVAPFYLFRAFHMPPNNAVATAIRADLQTLQRAGTPLDTHVQCLDGIAGCYSALYRLHLQSTTGFMGDQLLFQAVPNAAVLQARDLFQTQIAANPPTVIVETNYWYGGPQQFAKTATWPAFDTWLRTHYTLTRSRTFPEHTSDIDPIGYRIYLRHP